MRNNKYIWVEKLWFYFGDAKYFTFRKSTSVFTFLVLNFHSAHFMFQLFYFFCIILLLDFGEKLFLNMQVEKSCFKIYCFCVRWILCGLQVSFPVCETSNVTCVPSSANIMASVFFILVLILVIIFLCLPRI